MTTNRNAILVSVGLLLAGVIGMASACGREHRQGATEINQQLSGSPGANMNHAVPYGTSDGATGLNAYGAGVTPTPGPAGMAGVNTAAPGQDRIEVSQAIADQIAGMDEVKSANVLVTGRSAFVAVTLHYGAGVTNGADPMTNNRQIVDVSDQLKTKIAEKVKATNNGIDNVYVSANPDFVERVNVYAQDIRNGKPVSGFIKEFYNLVERMFPYKAASANNPPAAVPE
jgi:YhcN/YlaJ family sporulation lipoprotein